jgi:Uri superfamily endonuclease
MDSLPDSPGAYAIELLLSEACTVTVGQLGKFKFPPGIYIYSGSAFGPGGISARLGRHIRAKSKACRWHIDYLREITRRRACCYIQANPGAMVEKPYECSWSQALLSLPGAAVPVQGFGASDCISTCPAHLVCFPFQYLETKGARAVILQREVRAALAQAIQSPLEDLLYEAL